MRIKCPPQCTAMNDLFFTSSCLSESLSSATSLRYQRMSLEDASLLEAFYVFDVIPPPQEGAKPILYWCRTTKSDAKQPEVNQIGLFITFIGLCKRFHPDQECDYIRTSEREIGFLQLYKSIWMAICLVSTGSNNRFIIRSILEYCRSMFSHFFEPLPEVDAFTEAISEESFVRAQVAATATDPKANRVIRKIPGAFPDIVDSVNWTSLDYTLLYNSVSVYPLRDDAAAQLTAVCEDLRANDDMIDHIAVLAGHKVVATTFSWTVTRALAFGMRKRFKHMYMQNLQVSRDQLSWLVGLYMNRDSVPSIFQQLVYYDDEGHLIVAFRYRKYKIVLALKPEIEVVVSELKKIPMRLKRIKEVLTRAETEEIPAVPFQFVCSKNWVARQKSLFYGNMLRADAQSRAAINSIFIQIHRYAVNYSANATIAFKEPRGFSVWCQRTVKPESSEQMTAFKIPERDDEGVTMILRVATLFVEKERKVSGGKRRSRCEVM